MVEGWFASVLWVIWIAVKDSEHSPLYQRTPKMEVDLQFFRVGCCSPVDLSQVGRHGISDVCPGFYCLATGSDRAHMLLH